MHATKQVIAAVARMCRETPQEDFDMKDLDNAHFIFAHVAGVLIGERNMHLPMIECQELAQKFGREVREAFDRCVGEWPSEIS